MGDVKLEGADPRLTEAIHQTLCGVSHHDSRSACKNQRKYELIAEAVARRLEATEPKHGAVTTLDDALTAHDRLSGHTSNRCDHCNAIRSSVRLGGSGGSDEDDADV